MALTHTNNSGARNQTITEKEYEFLRKLVYDHCRINLGPNKKELVMARLSKRLRACNIGSYQEYIQLLQSATGKSEMGNLIDAISTNHTYFFREGEHFSFLMETILTEFDAEQPSGQFRAWSAACSSGEEPYSLAILLNEHFRNHRNRWTIECSDISSKILQKANDGVFSKDRVERIRKDWLHRYFLKGNGKFEGLYQFHPEVSRNLNFQLLNLMSPTFPFKQPFNLILCRNVMIYFDRPTQEDLVNRMIKHLMPGGYLFIGHSESLNAIKHPLKLIKPAIYQLP